MVQEALHAVEEQYDENADEFTIEVDVGNGDFDGAVMPYAIGYCGSTHGLVDVSYLAQTLTFRRLHDHDPKQVRLSQDAAIDHLSPQFNHGVIEVSDGFNDVEGDLFVNDCGETDIDVPSGWEMVRVPCEVAQDGIIFRPE